MALCPPQPRSGTPNLPTERGLVMSDQEKLREAIQNLRAFAQTGIACADGRRGPPNGNETWEEILAVCRAAESTLPKTKMVECKLWVRFDARGKVVACGPLGAYCGSTFQMHEEAPDPKKWWRADVVFTGKAEVPCE